MSKETATAHSFDELKPLTDEVAFRVVERYRVLNKEEAGDAANEFILENYPVIQNRLSTLYLRMLSARGLMKLG